MSGPSSASFTTMTDSLDAQREIGLRHARRSLAIYSGAPISLVSQPLADADLKTKS